MKRIFILLIFLITSFYLRAQQLSSTGRAYVTDVSVVGVNNSVNYQFTKAGIIDPLAETNDQRDRSNIPDILIYPNPVLYDFVIQLPVNNLYNVSIIDMKGKVALDENDMHDQVRINCQDLRPGDYYVRIANNEGVVSKKIIKQ
ncbi:MAG: hypothetical protein JWN78_1397 [Bacteroidota bacterium]|nr:hypothetical protein [Bacteroidota bacterium]